MNRRQFTAALAMLPAGLRAAETAQDRGKRVIVNCIHALGGESFRQMPGLLQTGTAYSFYSDQISGLSPAKIYTKYLDAGQPFREVQRQELGKKGDEAVILTATEGWDITYRGAEPIPADRIARFKDTLLTDIFYILRVRFDEPNMTWFSKGADVVENQPVEIVDCYDADNRSVTVWIHSTTWLPVMQLVKRWDPLYKEQREEYTRFTKYGDAGDGIVWPHTIQRSRENEKIFQLFSDSAKVGTFPDSMFALPPGEKILKPK